MRSSWVRDAGQGPLADHLTLQKYFPNELADARTHGLQGEIGILAGFADFGQHFAETHPEQGAGGRQKY